MVPVPMFLWIGKSDLDAGPEQERGNEMLRPKGLAGQWEDMRRVLVGVA